MGTMEVEAMTSMVRRERLARILKDYEGGVEMSKSWDEQQAEVGDQL
jgi:hypothetical protein